MKTGKKNHTDYVSRTKSYVKPKSVKRKQQRWSGSSSASADKRFPFTKTADDRQICRNSSLNRLFAAHRRFVERLRSKYFFFSLTGFKIRNKGFGAQLEFMLLFISIHSGFRRRWINKNYAQNNYSLTNQFFINVNPVFARRSGGFRFDKRNCALTSHRIDLFTKPETAFPFQQPHISKSGENHLAMIAPAGQREAAVHSKTPTPLMLQRKSLLQDQPFGFIQKYQTFFINRFDLKNDTELKLVSWSKGGNLGNAAAMGLPLVQLQQDPGENGLPDTYKIFTNRGSGYNRDKMFNMPELEYSFLSPKMFSVAESIPGASLGIGKNTQPEIVEERLQALPKASISHSGQSPADMSRIADQVYHLIEKKIQIENERSGKWY